MKDDWLAEWTESKIDLAERLHQGECGGSYAEAIIILCNVLSGISADIWPGLHKDKKRFVELLVKYTDGLHDCKRVSIPLLVGAIRDSGETILAEKIKKELLPISDSRIITGDDVDKYIFEIQEKYPEIQTKLLKNNAYATILYEEVRSGYVHEYRPGRRADSWPISDIRQSSHVSYVNMASLPDRLIYFNVSWLVSLIREIVANLLNEDFFPCLKQYNNWWLGAPWHRCENE